MIFATIYGSSSSGELILIDGGFCRWHERRDGIIVIYEIISQRRGAGQEILQILEGKGRTIQAKCPSDLPANRWYERRGFSLFEKYVVGKAGTREINVWRKEGEGRPMCPVCGKGMYVFCCDCDGNPNCKRCGGQVTTCWTCENDECAGWRPLEQ